LSGCSRCCGWSWFRHLLFEVWQSTGLCCCCWLYCRPLLFNVLCCFELFRCRLLFNSTMSQTTTSTTLGKISGSSCRQYDNTQQYEPILCGTTNSNCWQYSKTQRYEPLLCQIRESSCQQYDQPQQLRSILKSTMTTVSWQRLKRKLKHIIPIYY
jgi:hypothetical protein